MGGVSTTGDVYVEVTRSPARKAVRAAAICAGVAPVGATTVRVVGVTVVGAPNAYVPADKVIDGVIDDPAAIADCSYS